MNESERKIAFSLIIAAIVVAFCGAMYVNEDALDNLISVIFQVNVTTVVGLGALTLTLTNLNIDKRLNIIKECLALILGSGIIFSISLWIQEVITLRMLYFTMMLLNILMITLYFVHVLVSKEND